MLNIACLTQMPKVLNWFLSTVHDTTRVPQDPRPEVDHNMSEQRQKNHLLSLLPFPFQTQECTPNGGVVEYVIWASYFLQDLPQPPPGTSMIRRP
jgi:hypothetical protein